MSPNKPKTFDKALGMSCPEAMFANKGDIDLTKLLSAEAF